MKALSRRFTLAVMVIVLMLAVIPSKLAWAKPTSDLSMKDISSGTVKLSYIEDPVRSDDNKYIIYTENGRRVANIRSSDTKVASASYNKTRCEFKIAVKGRGTTRLSYRYKGKDHTVTIKVAKWKQPLSVLKVGSKSFTLKKTHTYRTANLGGKKITATAASGWKVKSIVCCATMSSMVGVPGRLPTTIKSGDKSPSWTYYVQVTLVHTETGRRELIWVQRSN